MENSDTETNCRQWFFAFGLFFVLFCFVVVVVVLNHTTTRKCEGSCTCHLFIYFLFCVNVNIGTRTGPSWLKPLRANLCKKFLAVAPTVQQYCPAENFSPGAWANMVA